MLPWPLKGCRHGHDPCECAARDMVATAAAQAQRAAQVTARRGWRQEGAWASRRLAFLIKNGNFRVQHAGCCLFSV
jgi:hypothetical protein